MLTTVTIVEAVQTVNATVYLSISAAIVNLNTVNHHVVMKIIMEFVIMILGNANVRKSLEGSDASFIARLDALVEWNVFRIIIVLVRDVLWGL